MGKSIFTKEEQQFIEENYKNMTYKEIGEILGFTERQIKGRVNNCLPNKRVRDYDERYFKNIDCPNKAYWLGFIYADGWISNNKRRKNCNELGIELQKSDKEHLIKFSNTIGGSRKIQDQHIERVILNNKNPSITDSSKTRLYSTKLVKDLMNNGIELNKTKKETIPHVNDELFFDFLRGYFDGDGCFYINKRKSQCYPQIHFTCCKEKPLLYLQEKLKQFNISSSVYKETDTKHRLVIFTKDDVFNLVKNFYKDKDCCKLTRKYEKIKNYYSSSSIEI